MNKIPKLRLKYFRNTKHKVEHDQWTFYKKCYRNHTKYFWETNRGFDKQQLSCLITNIENIMSNASYAYIPYMAAEGVGTVKWTILLELSEEDSAYMHFVQDSLLELSTASNGLAPGAYFYS